MYEEFGTTAEQLAQAANTLAEAWKYITVTIEAAANALSRFFTEIVAAAELKTAIRAAEAHNRPLAYRYHHTKKKRIRKKYAKKILAWYRQEIGGWPLC